jgi:hypothetical protein
MKLGIEVTETVSGMTGTLIAKTTDIVGYSQWAIQPKGDGKDLPDADFFDHYTLTKVGDGCSADLPPMDPMVTIELGDVCEDIITGFRGTATKRQESLNGCVFFKLEPVKIADELSLAKTLNHRRLCKVDEVEEVKETFKAGQLAHVGGPSSKYERID